jgi:hypothetical protein
MGQARLMFIFLFSFKIKAGLCLRMTNSVFWLPSSLSTLSSTLKTVTFSFGWWFGRIILSYPLSSNYIYGTDCRLLSLSRKTNR